MKKRIASFTLGFAAALALSLCLTTALAASGQVSYNFANVNLDGIQKIAAGQEITAANAQKIPGSILYTDAAGGKTNYLPIRTISELLGVEIGYDSAAKTVLLGKQRVPGGETSVTNPSNQNHASWVADGWKATITRAGGTVEELPNLSDLPAAAPAGQTADPKKQAETIPGRQWLRLKERMTVSYYGPEEAGQPKYDQPPAFRPAWLPEGWGLKDSISLNENNLVHRWSYGKGDGKLDFTCYLRSAGHLGISLYDWNAPRKPGLETPTVELQEVQVLGRKADFYQAGSTGYLFWEDEGGNLFLLEGNLDQTAMIPVAESVKEVKG
ncbi:DUF4367 domain-containing protein [uncultured Oscillibacter sp.]|uniref:DUF4367 domain-containing protein n=1 Tax=uncultured Oscillibacter sp. TaxID=876091 RepID=UPI0026263F59|nr:DUF4367 domain-containing protein [uncultured Oscillibacter sp.]